MSVTTSPPMFLQFFDPNNTGAPLVGGKLFTYIAGTSTKQATWTDSTQTVQNSNPIILDANGVCNVWLDPTLNYKFVLSPANDTDPPVSPLRTVDNIQGNLTLAQITASFLGTVLYPRTSTEIALSITPTNYQYPTDMYVDPRRYGADSTGVADSTAALNSAVAVALAGGGTVFLAENCIYKTTGITVAMTIANNSFRILGAGYNSQLIVSGTPNAALTISNTNTANPLTAYVSLENFMINGPGGATTVDGLLLKGIGTVNISNVLIQKFAHALALISALDVHARHCQFNSSATGVFCRPDGLTGSGTNSLTLDCCLINSNSSWGIDYDSVGGGMGQVQLRVVGCDLEANGTNASTGAITIGANIAVFVGLSMIQIEGTWFESNSQSIVVANPSTGLTFIGIENCVTFSETTGNAIIINGGNNVRIVNTWSPSAGATWNITCNQLALEDVNVTIMTDNSVWPTYVNVLANSVHSYMGRPDSFTATLTGCTTSPTGTVNVRQQGDQVFLQFPGITGTSNTTACTLTGLPAKYQPTGTNKNQVVAGFNNSAVTALPFEIDIGSGTMTFNFTFTNAGTKGIQPGEVRYKLVN